MADEDPQGETRTVHPKGPNAGELAKTKKKYKTFDQKARTEYDRLVKENNKHILKPTTDAVQHATFYWLCELREGSMHSYNFTLNPVIYKCIYFIEQIFFLNKPPPPRKGKTHKVQFSCGHLLVVHAKIILALIRDLFPIFGL
jgi:hypothetical protein